ncbi:hypothetical protein J1N35_000899 [Gossypium stocksii]|uniref:Uncharacterized protein n=1 Tax=Gossypium stocksii TaxID=47602 RepID=A0A9D3WIC2_9ROSI|nr:hypothetical protein J1N35_000899 [Gossypium stocksii]
MTHGKDTPTMKETETSKTRTGKTKKESKGTNLITETSLLHKMNDIEKLANSIRDKQLRLLSPTPLLEFLVFPPIIQEYEPSSEEDNLGDRDRLVESLPIVHVSNVEKEEDSRDVEKRM